MKCTYCKSCEAHIIYARHSRTNKLMPLDAEPDERGTIWVYRDTDGVTRFIVLTPLEAIGRSDLRTAHFSNCPHADKWRKD